MESTQWYSESFYVASLESKQKLPGQIYHTKSRELSQTTHTQDIRALGQTQSSLSGVKKVQIEDHLQGCHQAKWHITCGFTGGRVGAVTWERGEGPKILLARNRLRKLLHCRCVTCHKIEEWQEDGTTSPEERAKSPQGLVPGLETESRKVEHLPDFKTIMDLCFLLTFISSFLSQSIYKHYPIPSHHCMLGVLGWINGLFSVTRPQMESNCVTAAAHAEMIPRSHTRTWTWFRL